mmetsp:Transcript_11841/g.15651  ORF Transcript_11841/g.15651 Transcript_11841/m.15651 type:complete len:205 (+) Transcript_11841:372-986(+)
MSGGGIMPTLSCLDRGSNHRIGQFRGLLFQFGNFNLGRLFFRGQVSKFILNDFFCFGRINISHKVQQHIVRTVVSTVPCTNIIVLPIINQNFLSNGEPFGQSIFTVKSGKDLTFDTVFNRIDHGHFTQDGGTFLFQAGRFDTCFHDIDKGVQGHGEHWGIPPGCFNRTGGIKDGMMKIRVGIGLRPGPKETFAFPGSHVGDMFG